MKNMIEGAAITHPEYGETHIDCVPAVTDFGSMEPGEFAYLARIILPDRKVRENLPLTEAQRLKKLPPTTVTRTIAGGNFDPFVRLSELTFSQ